MTDVFVLVKKQDVDLNYFLAILNSSLINFYNSKFGKLKRDGYYEYSRNTLSRLPIKTNKTEKEMQIQNEISNLSEQLIKFYSEKDTLKLKTKIEQIESKIDYYENKINQLVYQLYDLTEKEIKIVEGTKS